MIKALQQIGSEIILPPVLQKLIDGEPAAKSTPADIHRTARRRMAQVHKSHERAVPDQKRRIQRITRCVDNGLAVCTARRNGGACPTGSPQPRKCLQPDQLAWARLRYQRQPSGNRHARVQAPTCTQRNRTSCLARPNPDANLATGYHPCRGNDNGVSARETAEEPAGHAIPKSPSPKKPKADSQQNKLQFPGRERSRSNNSNRFQPLSEDAEGEEGCPKQGKLNSSVL